MSASGADALEEAGREEFDGEEEWNYSKVYLKWLSERCMFRWFPGEAASDSNVSLAITLSFGLLQSVCNGASGNWFTRRPQHG